MNRFTLALVAGCFIAPSAFSQSFEPDFLHSVDFTWTPEITEPPIFIPIPGPIAPCAPMFEDLPLHAPWYVGDTFFSTGLQFDVVPFQWGTGVWFNGGKVYADNAGRACGLGQDLLTNNANVFVQFPTASVDHVGWNFGEYGGNINISINGDFRNVRNYLDLHGLIVGGVHVQIAWGGTGHDCGRVELHGVVHKLVVGGQEHWIDCIDYNPITAPSPPAAAPAACAPCFEDLLLGNVYLFNDTFLTSGWKMWVAPIEWVGGHHFFGGEVIVENGGAACGTDNELFTNNAVTKMFPTSGAMEDVYFRFGEYGGNINVAINGDFRNVDDMMDLHNLIIGGVRLEVLSGGHGNDCGDVQLHGVVRRMALGGQEFWYDCLTGTALAASPIQGDADGDGQADVRDLVRVLNTWGSSDPGADLDRNGVVDVRDLLESLTGMSSPISIEPNPSPSPIGIAPLPSP
jgi:hypothetical protein